MKILITGAFGNIGKAVIAEALKRHHEIIAFDIDNKKTRKSTRHYRNKIDNVIFGDIRDLETVKKAVQDSEIVIHLAAIIPPLSRKNRKLTMDVNYGGTENLIRAIKEGQSILILGSGISGIF